MSPIKMLLGMRVVRGPDWNLGNQDGGEGCVGTIVSLQTGENGRPLPDKSVLVCWDSGSAVTCRVGLGDCYDLRVFDSASAGVLHTHFTCDGCDQSGIAGMRWHCSECHDYDLCTDCYMNDVHEKDHIFVRFDKPNNRANGSFIGNRSTATKLEAVGIFPGAKVERGRHLTVDTDLGHMIGQVVDITSWEGTQRSAVMVKWSDTLETAHRLGYKGKVDLELIASADGPYYYKEHLPVVEQPPADSLELQVGDQVKVNLDQDAAKKMVEGNCGLSSFQIGRIFKIEDGEVHVAYGPVWTFHPDVLQKVPELQVQDETLNTTVDEYFKTLLVELQSGQKESLDESPDNKGEEAMISEIENSVVDGLVNLDSVLDIIQMSEEELSGIAEKENIWQLFQASKVGDLKRVEYLLRTDKDIVDQKSVNGKAALHVACHNGDAGTVSCLISNGADVELKDEDGYAPLHHAAYADKTGECVVLLLTANAFINVVNTNTGLTPLHLAVQQGNLPAVNALVHFGQCDVNYQNVSGNTPLHCAISFAEESIFIEILKVPSLDPYLCNKIGLNVLQLACLDNNVSATKALIDRFPRLVNVTNKDGFTPLHLAALSNHCEIAKLLVNNGHCSIDLPNNNGETALTLAVSLRYKEVTEFLIESGANVNAKDQDGDTPLHVAVMKYCMSHKGADLGLFGASEGREDKNLDYAIVHLLVLQGANINFKNNQGHTPLDVCVDDELARMLKEPSKYPSLATASNAPSPPLPTPPGDIKGRNRDPSTGAKDEKASDSLLNSPAKKETRYYAATDTNVFHDIDIPPATQDYEQNAPQDLSTAEDEERAEHDDVVLHDVDVTEGTVSSGTLQGQGSSAKTEFCIESKTIVERTMFTGDSESNISVTDVKKNLTIQFKILQEKLKEEKR